MKPLMIHPQKNWYYSQSYYPSEPFTFTHFNVRHPVHCWYIEPRNREKSLTLIWQRFSCLLDEWIAKISKKKIFSRWLFEIIHIIRFEIWDLRSRDLKIFLGYDINYLSIWPFMCHPWFPTRKASKLTLIWSSYLAPAMCSILGAENR